MTTTLDHTQYEIQDAIEGLTYIDLSSWFWFGHGYNLDAVLAALPTAAAEVVKAAAELYAPGDFEASEAAILAADLPAKLQAALAG